MPYHVRFGHAADLAWIYWPVAWRSCHPDIAGEPGERLKFGLIVPIFDWGEPVRASRVAEVIEQGCVSLRLG